LRRSHEVAEARHNSTGRTMDIVERNFYWLTWRGDTARSCRQCPECVRSRHERKLPSKTLHAPVKADERASEPSTNANVSNVEKPSMQDPPSTVNVPPSIVEPPIVRSPFPKNQMRSALRVNSHSQQPPASDLIEPNQELECRRQGKRPPVTFRERGPGPPLRRRQLFWCRG